MNNKTHVTWLFLDTLHRLEFQWVLYDESYKSRDAAAFVERLNQHVG